MFTCTCLYMWFWRNHLRFPHLQNKGKSSIVATTECHEDWNNPPMKPSTPSTLEAFNMCSLLLMIRWKQIQGAWKVPMVISRWVSVTAAVLFLLFFFPTFPPKKTIKNCNSYWEWKHLSSHSTTTSHSISLEAKYYARCWEYKDGGHSNTSSWGALKKV